MRWTVYRIILPNGIGHTCIRPDSDPVPLRARNVRRVMAPTRHAALVEYRRLESGREASLAAARRRALAAFQSDAD